MNENKRRNFYIEQCDILSKKYIKHREFIKGSYDASIPYDVAELFNHELIPQLYWGNLNDPEIVILGKNASYSFEDELDNYHFRGWLLLNLLSNKDSSRNFFCDILTNSNNIFINSSVSRYWRNAFIGWEPYENFKNKNNFMRKTAIINMYGFYSEELSEKPEEPSYLENEKEILDMIRNHITNHKPIYIMWKKSLKWWKDLLGVEFDPNNTYIVNGNNSRNKYLKNSVLLSSILSTDAKRQ